MAFNLSLVGRTTARVISLTLCLSPFSFAAGTHSTTNPNVVVQWNQAALQGVRDSTLGAPMVARALAIVHTCMYDAWAAYDDKAVGTQLGAQLRRPATDRTFRNKRRAMSYAAYRAVVDLFPWDKQSVFDPLMAKLGYDPSDVSTDVTTASGIGNVACAAVLTFRHSDGSNQLGELNPTRVPYGDYTGYQPVNRPSTVPVTDLSTIVDPNHWQPLTYFNGTGVVTPTFVAAQWYKVIPFALTSADEFFSEVQVFGPNQYGSAGYEEQAREIIDLTANLDDRQKMVAEYWANGPRSEQPPGHWDLFAQFVSARDHHTIDEDAKMFFALTNAIFDAGIAGWQAKRYYDSPRPVTAISYLFHDQQIRSWGGPGKGTVTMLGSQWIPYQAATFPTPPFPEFVSGHSTFSAAGATILALWTGSEAFGASVSFQPGSSVIEPGITPSHPVTLRWATFHNAANEAGLSRRYGGIHFRPADLAGRRLGDLVAAKAWEKAKTYFNGAAQ